MVWRDLVTFDLPWFGPVWSENRVPSPSPPWFTAWLTRVMVLKRSVCVPTSFHHTHINYWENVEFSFLCTYFLFILVGSSICLVISSFLLMCVEERGAVCPAIALFLLTSPWFSTFANGNKCKICFAALNDDTKILTETDSETFFPIPNFPKQKTRLFFWYKRAGVRVLS